MWRGGRKDKDPPSRHTIHAGTSSTREEVPGLAIELTGRAVLSTMVASASVAAVASMYMASCCSTSWAKRALLSSVALPETVECSKYTITFVLLRPSPCFLTMAA